jgi:hypothetical protein
MQVAKDAGVTSTRSLHLKGAREAPGTRGGAPSFDDDDDTPGAPLLLLLFMLLSGDTESSNAGSLFDRSWRTPSQATWRVIFEPLILVNFRAFETKLLTTLASRLFVGRQI